MRIILKKNKIDHNTRVIKIFLFKPLTLHNATKRGVVYIYQNYYFDNGWTSGVYKGWHWNDVVFEDKLK